MLGRELMGQLRTQGGATAPVASPAGLCSCYDAVTVHTPSLELERVQIFASALDVPVGSFLPKASHWWMGAGVISTECVELPVPFCGLV